MLDFKKLTLDDIQKIKPYFAYSKHKTCDNTVGGTFIWRDYFGFEYAETGGTLVFKAKLAYRGGITAFTVPLGEDIYGTMGRLDEYCAHFGMPLIYCTVTAEDMPHLNLRYRHTEVYQEPGWSDYLYRAEDIISLAGRKYSGQRNHINYFNKAHPGWAFEEITENNLGEVRAFYEAFSRTASKESEIFAEEQKKTFEVLDNYEKYGMLGGLVRAGGSVVAFSVGEIHGDVLHVHIEKADFALRGAYQVINSEFARHYATDGVEFVNREDDAGDEGLRASKRAYHPCEIIDKYVVKVES